MLRRLSQTAPRGARAFQKAKGETKAQKKKNAGGGRDAYAGIKQAILSEPDEELFLPSETPEEAHARKARTSRYFMQEHHMQRLARMPDGRPPAFDHGSSAGMAASAGGQAFGLRSQDSNFLCL